MTTTPASTGEPGAALHRSTVVTLTTDVGPRFPAATIVAAQHRGQGKVVPTRFRTVGPRP